MIDLTALLQQNLEIARDQGFGCRPEEIVVAEKIALIHSEISESYEAFLSGNFEGKHGFYEEIADVLLRTLHLAGVFGVHLRQLQVPDDIPGVAAGQIAFLHQLASRAYEYYRHKKMEAFKDELIRLAWAVVHVSRLYAFSLEEVAREKMEYNKTRVYHKDEMNEHIN